jgi:hypothetical protein
VKMPSQLHRRVINREEEKIKDVPPWHDLREQAASS